MSGAKNLHIIFSVLQPKIYPLRRLDIPVWPSIIVVVKTDIYCLVLFSSRVPEIMSLLREGP